MASNASARHGVGSGGKTAFGDGNGSDGRGTTGNLPRGAYGDRILASREDWVGCGGGSGAIGSSGTVVRNEVASYGERPSSGPRAIAGVVEVLLLMLGVSRQRIGAAAGGESSTESGVAARLTSDVRDGGDWVAVTNRGRSFGRVRRPSTSVVVGEFDRWAGLGRPDGDVGRPTTRCVKNSNFQIPT
jgi:hypothetical protein